MQLPMHARELTILISESALSRQRYMFLFPRIRFFLIRASIIISANEHERFTERFVTRPGSLPTPADLFHFCLSALINNCLKIRRRISVILRSMITHRRLSMFHRDSRNSNAAENVRKMKRAWIKYLLGEKLNISRTIFCIIFLLLIFRK